MNNYLKDTEDNVRQFMFDNADKVRGHEVEEVREWLEDTCFVADEVTGNASGSFFCSRARAYEYLTNSEDGFETLGYAVFEGWMSEQELGKRVACGDWESLDCMVRCYWVARAVQNVTEEWATCSGTIDWD